MEIKGRVAIVTGGAGLVGKAFCEALVKKGAKVCIADINEENAAKVSDTYNKEYKNGSCIPVQCDVTSDDSLNALFDTTTTRLGRPDILINSAAVFDEFNWRKIVDVNMVGVYNLTLKGLERMGRDKGGNGGVIINVSSRAGYQRFIPMPMYSATKAALESFTLTWAHSLNFKKHGVRLNIVTPALVQVPEEDQAQRHMPAMYHADIILPKLVGSPTVPADRVAAGLIELLEDDTKNSAILEVGPDGARYREATPCLPPEDDNSKM